MMGKDKCIFRRMNRRRLRSPRRSGRKKVKELNIQRSIDPPSKDWLLMPKLKLWMEAKKLKVRNPLEMRFSPD